MRRRELIAGLAVTAAGLFLFWLTLGLERNPLVPIGPGFYPRIVFGLTVLLGIALAVSAFLAKEQEARKPGIDYTAVALQFAAFGVYAALLPLIGFRLATVAYVAAANLLLDPPRRAVHGGRAAASLARALVLGVVTALVTYYAFEGYLSVLLPRGAWTDF